MKQRFKGKKRIKSGLIKFIILLLMVLISFFYTFKWLYGSIDLSLDNETYMKYLINDSFGSYAIEDIANLSSIDFLLKYSFGIKEINTGLVEKEITTPIRVEKPMTNTKPLVYIYNTHQTESYKNEFLETFNINNTVLFASHILKEYLTDLGINTIVEENSVVDILNTNGWKYGSSYKASRILMENAKKENPSIDFFIDLHRDAASYERTTLEIDGESYAKVMFVIGLENENYEKNLKFANAINDKIKEFNPDLTRGVLEKQGKGVNGLYNQDISPNTILIEMGGQYNTIEEVNNTLKVLSKILFSYIKEEQNEEKEN